MVIPRKKQYLNDSEIYLCVFLFDIEIYSAPLKIRARQRIAKTEILDRS
jgi:hypothetical protein